MGRPPPDRDRSPREKLIRAVLTSEGIHAGLGHKLGAMVDEIPVENPIKPKLARLTGLAAYATAFRSATASRIPPGPSQSELRDYLQGVQDALELLARHHEVDPTATRPAGVTAPMR